MRKKYEDPEFELIRIQLSDALLGPSTFNPEDELKEDEDDVEP